MKRSQRMALLAGAVFLAAACGSNKLRVSPKDGAADSGTGGGLGTGGTDAGTLGGGGTAVTTIPGGSGGVGSGGNPGSGGGPGTGGSSGTGGSRGTGGSPGTGGSTGTGGAFRDAAAGDVARDQAGALDTGVLADAADACGPGYPVGSSRPQGDGCNTCYCQSNGSWMCTTKACPPPADGGTDTPIAPSDVRLDATPPDGGVFSCAQATTQAECEASVDCHAVFNDPGDCKCAVAGCCARFVRCADGKAQCTGNPMCEMMTPHCEGPYVVSYTAICYEGCVLSTECAP